MLPPVIVPVAVKSPVRVSKRWRTVLSNLLLNAMPYQLSSAPLNVVTEAPSPVPLIKPIPRFASPGEATRIPSRSETPLLFLCLRGLPDHLLHVEFPRDLRQRLL